MNRRIDIGSLTGGLQARSSNDEETIRDYAEAMQSGAEFPPVTVFKDTAGRFFLADGYHRVEAAKANGERTIPADVRPGSFADALRHALGANARHGLRRSNADKQNALALAWENRRALFGELDPTADWLAETCGVSLRTAKTYYETISANCTDLTPQRTNAAGRVYTIPTRPPTRTPPPPVRPSQDTPKPPQERAARPGYYLATDGSEHAQGVRLDCFGVEVPDRIKAAFDHAPLDEIKKHLRAARDIAKGETDKGNPAFAQYGQRELIELENCIRAVKFAKAFCVCPMCQGNGCGACADTGFQTEDQFDRNPPDVLDDKHLAELQRRKR